jgi:hypothetical protein
VRHDEGREQGNKGTREQENGQTHFVNLLINAISNRLTPAERFSVCLYSIIAQNPGNDAPMRDPFLAGWFFLE